MIENCLDKQIYKNSELLAQGGGIGTKVKSAPPDAGAEHFTLLVLLSWFVSMKVPDLIHYSISHCRGF